MTPPVMAPTVVHQLKASLPVLFIRERRTFIAYTPALDLSAWGSTAKAARKNFETTLRLFFEEVMAAGTLDEVLREQGWSKQQHGWRPPVEVQKILYVPLRVPVST